MVYVGMRPGSPDPEKRLPVGRERHPVGDVSERVAVQVDEVPFALVAYEREAGGGDIRRRILC